VSDAPVGNTLIVLTEPRVSDELSALLATLDDTDPSALTSCPGWTAHHIAAHIAGNYEEVRRHVEAYASGHALAETRTWEAREQTWRALGQPALLRSIEREAARAMSAVRAVLDVDPAAEFRWTNRTVAVSGFPTHMRSEDALHRWDLVGDDDISGRLLAQPELLEHAVHFIGRPLTRRGLAFGSGNRGYSARVRAAGYDDLVVEVENGDAMLSIGAPTDEPTIEADPAARLLIFWGRKPTPFSRVRACRGEDEAGRLQLVLSGY
jgi:uncharacterized protein (TIGR03083 family)